MTMNVFKNEGIVFAKAVKVVLSYSFLLHCVPYWWFWMRNFFSRSFQGTPHTVVNYVSTGHQQKVIRKSFSAVRTAVSRAFS
jgi:hypothetical protein